MSGVQEASSSSSHKEESVSRKGRAEKDVNKLISIIDSCMINPFSLDGITEQTLNLLLCVILQVGQFPAKTSQTTFWEPMKRDSRE